MGTQFGAAAIASRRLLDNLAYIGHSVYMSRSGPECHTSESAERKLSTCLACAHVLYTLVCAITSRLTCPTRVESAISSYIVTASSPDRADASQPSHVSGMHRSSSGARFAMSDMCKSTQHAVNTFNKSATVYWLTYTAGEQVVAPSAAPMHGVVAYFSPMRRNIHTCNDSGQLQNSRIQLRSFWPEWHGPHGRLTSACR